MTENLIGSAYDLTAWYHSWKRIQQLDQVSEGYLAEVQASSRRMRQIVVRLGEIRATPGCGVAPAPTSGQPAGPEPSAGPVPSARGRRPKG